jgi:hypothetical protein
LFVWIYKKTNLERKGSYRTIFNITQTKLKQTKAMGRYNNKPNDNGTNDNDNADTGPNVQVVPLMAGMGTLVFFVLMAVIVCCLRKRVQRRVALENEQHRLNAQHEAQRRKKCRKENAEALIVTQVRT